MKSPRFQPRRYQLKKNVAEALAQGHPWVFRDKVSTAAEVFPDGQWLDLVNSQNQRIGTGIYQSQGGVAIRVLRLGEHPVSLGWLDKQLARAVRKRAPLLAETDAYRLLNGESDGLPGVVLDVYAGVGVLQTYTAGVDALGRYLAGKACSLLGLSALVWKLPSKRSGGGQTDVVRVLRGNPKSLVRFREGKLHLAADVLSGQKSGTFLDLRGLRRLLSTWDLTGKKVLNLFAYTGTAGLACCLGGAREVHNVDLAQASLDFGQKYHGHKAQRWICADIFSWIKSLPVESKYDLIVVDPPSMASNKTQVPKALATYRRLYTSLIKHLAEGGTMVGCCCTSRISPREFEDAVRQSLKGFQLVERLPMELDHKPTFTEANYLKVLTLRARYERPLAVVSARPRKAGPPTPPPRKRGARG